MEDVYDRIKKLERQKMEYLEIDNKSSANRIAKKIKELETQIELQKYTKLKNELDIYKETVKKYPWLQNIVEQKIKEGRK